MGEWVLPFPRSIDQTTRTMPVETTIAPTDPARRGPGRILALILALLLILLVLAPGAILAWAWFSPEPAVLGPYTLLGPRSPGTVVLWNVRTGRPLTPRFRARTAAFASDGRLLFVRFAGTPGPLPGFRRIVWQWGGFTLLGP
jgi:hypothetical protein